MHLHSQCRRVNTVAQPEVGMTSSLLGSGLSTDIEEECDISSTSPSSEIGGNLGVKRPCGQRRMMRGVDKIENRAHVLRYAVCKCNSKQSEEVNRISSVFSSYTAECRPAAVRPPCCLLPAATHHPADTRGRRAALLVLRRHNICKLDDCHRQLRPHRPHRHRRPHRPHKPRY